MCEHGELSITSVQHNRHRLIGSRAVAAAMASTIDNARAGVDTHCLCQMYHFTFTKGKHVAPEGTFILQLTFVRCTDSANEKETCVNYVDVLSVSMQESKQSYLQACRQGPGPQEEP